MRRFRRTKNDAGWALLGACLIFFLLVRENPWWWALPAGLLGLYGLYRFLRLRWLRSLSAYDHLSGQSFEGALAELYTALGYRVEHSGKPGDFGGDLIISKAGERTVVQAKRYKGSVGVAAVQEAYAAKAFYGCDSAFVVTTSTFSRQAKALAGKTGVLLFDRKALAHMRRSAGLAVTAPGTVGKGTTCNECGIPVSGAVATFCRTRERQFGGKVFCIPHQAAFR